MKTKYSEVTVLPDGRMDTKNAAIYTGFSEKTLAMKRCEGRGPKYIKLGKIFYFQKELDEWIESSSRKTSVPSTNIGAK